MKRPLPPPASEARPNGRLHSRLRDAQVISHHYDLSNALYTLLLDENMAYSCAYWTSDDPTYTVADAQRDKLDLICRKLDLRPGVRLLDVGCGWGALSVHAAKEYGAQVTGVTISQRAARVRPGSGWRAEGLEHLVDLRLQDYRDLDATAPYDAISTIEMGEHVGAGQLPGVPGDAAPAAARRGPAADAADVARHRTTPAAARSSSPTSRRTCTCGRCPSCSA